MFAKPARSGQRTVRKARERAGGRTLESPSEPEGRDVGHDDRPDAAMQANRAVSFSARWTPGHVRGHAAAADASNDAGCDELGHVAGKAAEETADGEDGVGEEEAAFAAEDVAELKGG